MREDENNASRDGGLGDPPQLRPRPEKPRPKIKVQAGNGFQTT